MNMMFRKEADACVEEPIDYRGSIEVRPIKELRP